MASKFRKKVQADSHSGYWINVWTKFGIFSTWNPSFGYCIKISFTFSNYIYIKFWTKRAESYIYRCNQFPLLLLLNPSKVDCGLRSDKHQTHSATYSSISFLWFSTLIWPFRIPTNVNPYLSKIIKELCVSLKND